MFGVLSTVALVLSLLFHSLPAYAQSQTPRISCYTAVAGGTRERPTSTFWDTITSTGPRVEEYTSTTTVTKRVPDVTTTIHKQITQTDYHAEYFETFTSTHWRIVSTTMARPTITITVPPSLADLSISLIPDENIPKQKRQDQEDYSSYELVGEVILPSAEPPHHHYDTVVCNYIYPASDVETKTKLEIVNSGVAKRTITLTQWHTRTVNEFRVQPGVIETNTKRTMYKAYTTTFETVTPTDGG